jgi:hypothetical protein
MIKGFLFLLILSSSISCAPPASPPPQTTSTDEYVLIEFAARLEEDYHKENNGPIHKQ